MFPYFEQPSLSLGSYTLYFFQVAVCTAVILGYEIVVRRAPRTGLDSEEVASVLAWVILWGFVGSHVFDTLAYYPERIREDPLVLVKIWGSMSSFGGMMGGMAAALVLARRKGWSGRQTLALADGIGFGFPFAWIFGRLGCALAHDHVGVPTDHWLGVRFPEGTRFDLGLLELLYTIPIAALFYFLDRKPRPNGFFLGLFLALYGPVRFVLDTLRTGDARYLDWTPGQYVAIL
ncbi:MAG TPA: prolipoprotein diacylglyceryl transferase family protein, partial [Myxococcota bacterium]|nr:prolipoprotein diacylglyceryl transferase family protein [Myxococcota bacterium]